MRNHSLKIIILTYTYNVEKYIAKTFDSVINQTYQNWEWYLVENASTDKTADIIDDLLMKCNYDKRIHYSKRKVNSIFHPHDMEEDIFLEERPKLFGRDYYFTTLDSDDYFEYDALENMIEPVIQYDVDMVIAGRRGFMDGSKEFCVKNLPTNKIYKNIEELGNDWVTIYPCIRTTWCKLFRFDTFWNMRVQNIADINTLKNGNDTFGNLIYLSMADSVACIDKVTVNFCIRNNSIFASNVYPKRYLSYKKIYNSTYDLLERWGKNTNYNSMFTKQVLKTSMLETVKAASKYIHTENLQLISNILTDTDIYKILSEENLYEEMTDGILAMILQNAAEDSKTPESAYGYFHHLLYKALKLVKNNAGDKHLALCLIICALLNEKNVNKIGISCFRFFESYLDTKYYKELLSLCTKKMRYLLEGDKGFFVSLFIQDKNSAISYYRNGYKDYYNILRSLLESLESEEEKTKKLENTVLINLESNNIKKLNDSIRLLEKLKPFGSVTLYGKLFLLCNFGKRQEAISVAMTISYLYPDNAFMVDTSAMVFEEYGLFETAASIYESYLPYAKEDEIKNIQDRISELYTENKIVPPEGRYTVTVIGLGFVGLTTALGFASKGNIVYGYDIDTDRTNTIAAGKLPFKEPGLDSALADSIGVNFFIGESVVQAARKSDVIFFCVGTPCKENGEVDLRYLFNAIDSISEALADDSLKVLVIKSTIPPSTTKNKIIPYVNDMGIDHKKTAIATNPEFLREGYCWHDFMNADRIVCGTDNDNAAKVLKNLYAPFDCPLYIVSYNTAEFIKYLSNTMLAAMISFANEMSIVADRIGDINIKESFEILHMDGRWGNGNMKSYIYPGCGYGGYCLPKDTAALYMNSVMHGYEPGILKNVISVNDKMAHFFADKIMREFGQTKKLGILGLSFKPDSDDVRKTASESIIGILTERADFEIHAFDPVANDNFAKYTNFHINYHDTKEALLSECDNIAVITAWEEFLDLRETYPDKKFIDCRYRMK